MMKLDRFHIPMGRDVFAFVCHLLAGLLLGLASLVLSPQIVLIALLGIVGGGLVMQQPALGILGIFVATSSIVYENQLPLIPILIGSLHVPDFILLGLFVLMLWRWIAEPGFTIVRTPSDAYLVGFWLITLFSSLVAIGDGTLQFNTALRGIRTGTYYLLFFVVTNVIRRREQLMFLLQGIFLLSTGVAAAMIVQYFVGDSISILPGRVEALVTGSTSYLDIARIMPPGQSLIFVSAVTLVSVVGFDVIRQASLFRVALVGLIGIALVLTFLRTFWLMTGLIGVLMFVLSKGVERRRMLGWILLAVIVLSLVGILLLSDPDSPAQDLVGAVLERFGTVSGTQFVEDSSFVWRFSEYDHAIPQILAHPLLGLGAGAQYRPYDPRMDWEQFDGRAYIHNGHLWIMLQCGLPGYFCFMTWILWTAFRGLRIWRNVRTPVLRGTMVSFSLLLLVLPIGAIVDPVYMQWFWTPVLGVMAGVIEVIARLGLAGTEAPEERAKTPERAITGPTLPQEMA